MTKDEIIENLTSTIAELNGTIKELKEELSAQSERFREVIDSLNKRIAELSGDIEEVEKEKQKAVEGRRKAEREKKAVCGLLGKKQESQSPGMSEEEKEKLRELQAKARKERGNNNARHGRHDELDEEIIYLKPDDPDFDILKARLIGGVDKDGNPLLYMESYRIKYIPGRFVKYTYRMPRYSFNDKIYRAKAPAAAIFNSNYDGTVLALLVLLRYVYNMPVERVCRMFGDMGINMPKATAHGLLERVAGTYENYYKAIHEEVFRNAYISIDETYHRILVENRSGKNSKKGYFWVVIGVKSRLVYVIYEDGSRSEDVILKEFDPIRDRKIVLQSDAFSAYKKLESDLFQNITRLSCTQHVKRKFIDCGENDKDAVAIRRLLSELYHKEHEHEIGKDGWTAEDNLRWRRQYAPPILDRIRKGLDRLLKLPESELPPKSDLYNAVHYLDNEFDAISNIFTIGDSFLDNNLVERYNRYFSMSRRSSLFFGSHQGAERAAVLYTIALSCKMNGLNVYDYLADTMRRTAEWQPNTPLDKYRALLPNKWSKAQE